MIQLKYLVTGTGRCGTVFFARLLTSLGIPCGHEVIFDYRGWDTAQLRLKGESPLQLSYVSIAKYDFGKWLPLPEWLPDLSVIQAESSYMAAPFLSRTNIPSVHVVRNPIRVVTSFCHHVKYFLKEKPTNGYEEFIYEILPELRSKLPQPDRACLYYILWNQMITRQEPTYFYRAEDLPEKLMQEWGLTGNPFKDSTVNTLRQPGSVRFSLDQIESQTIKDQFINLGKEYGYTMDSEYLLV